jgi:hypothetical protein
MLEVSVYYPICTKKDEQVGDKVRIEFVLPKRPFLFWSDYHEAEMIQYPRGYGVAYADLPKNRLLMAPMPFNILIGGLIWGYHWFRVGFAAWCWKHRPQNPKG